MSWFSRTARQTSRYLFPISTAVALVVWSMQASPVMAQPGPDVTRAQEHYVKAEKAMQAGEFKTAAAEYSAAYEVTKDAALFFKIGSAHQKAGDCVQALEFFRRYLAEGAPTDEYKQMTAERIAACEQKAGSTGQTGADPAVVGTPGTDAGTAGDPAMGETATSDTTTAETATGDAATDTAIGDTATDTAGDTTTGDVLAAAVPPNFADRKPTWQRNVAWIGVGTSLTFATIGAILGMSAASHEEDLDNLINFRYPNGLPAEYTGNARAQYEELVSEGQALSTWSRVALGLAAASAVTATVFFVIDPGRAERRSAHVVPTVSHERVGVSAGWRF